MAINKVELDPTAFMSGQVLSKKWLCLELERIAVGWNYPVTIDVMAGWYCMTNFLLQTRGVLPINKVTSYDIDPKASAGALVLNETFVFEKLFETKTIDANLHDYGTHPDIVINTSIEHIVGNDWFHNIPEGTTVVLQSTDMAHDHDQDQNAVPMSSVNELNDSFPLSTVIYHGTKHFDYADWNFNRFMIIGVK